MRGWQVDRSRDADDFEKDPNGWGYAAGFNLGGGSVGLSPQGSFDNVRRRRWTRLMVQGPPPPPPKKSTPPQAKSS